MGHYRWFRNQFPPFSPLFFTALWDLTNSRPVHSLMLSSHLFLCPPCLLPPFTVLCRMVLARPDERETWPYHCSLRLITMVRRSSCGLIACWIWARTRCLRLPRWTFAFLITFVILCSHVQLSFHDNERWSLGLTSICLFFFFYLVSPSQCSNQTLYHFYITMIIPCPGDYLNRLISWCARVLVLTSVILHRDTSSQGNPVSLILLPQFVYIVIRLTKVALCVFDYFSHLTP